MDNQRHFFSSSLRLFSSQYLLRAAAWPLASNSSAGPEHNNIWKSIVPAARWADRRQQARLLTGRITALHPDSLLYQQQPRSHGGGTATTQLVFLLERLGLHSRASHSSEARFQLFKCTHGIFRQNLRHLNCSSNRLSGSCDSYSCSNTTCTDVRVHSKKEWAKSVSQSQLIQKHSRTSALNSIAAIIQHFQRKISQQVR